MQQPAVDSGSSTLDANNETPPSAHDVTADRTPAAAIPPWVQVAHTAEEAERIRRLKDPPNAIYATHNYLPAPQHKPQQHKAPGRKWDHLRDAEPALLDQPLDVSSARWLPYMLSGPRYPEAERARLMSDEWMEENMPGMGPSWRTHAEAEAELAEKERAKGFWMFHAAGRRNAYTRTEVRRLFVEDVQMRSNGLQRTILKNPFVPLVFRLIVFTFTVAALGLGARVFAEADKQNKHQSQIGCVQRASTYMAIILDSIAVPYILYVTWDEYMSKPLGLRSAVTKTAMLLLDLYFICFYSSNLSLAIDALNDPRWACFNRDEASQTCPHTPGICHSQAGLTGVLVIALIAWLITFSISVLRVVERLQ